MAFSTDSKTDLTDIIVVSISTLGIEISSLQKVLRAVLKFSMNFLVTILPSPPRRIIASSGEAVNIIARLGIKEKLSKKLFAESNWLLESLPV